MSRITAKGTRLYIGGHGSLASEAAWVLVKDVTNIPEISQVFQEITYVTLAGVENYEKGAKSTVAVTVEYVRDDADDGQADFEAAAADETPDRDYNFRIVWGPEITETGLSEAEQVFKAKVFGSGNVIGDATQMISGRATMRVKVDSIAFTASVLS